MLFMALRGAEGKREEPRRSSPVDCATRRGQAGSEGHGPERLRAGRRGGAARTSSRRSARQDADP
eukprot:6903765-Pyramimonas_sp.AAC.1